jgi:hypothetical protein
MQSPSHVAVLGPRRRVLPVGHVKAEQSGRQQTAWQSDPSDAHVVSEVIVSRSLDGNN